MDVTDLRKKKKIIIPILQMRGTEAHGGLTCLVSASQQWAEPGFKLTPG